MVRVHVVKVFVTGGTGFIGGEVVRQLRDRGDDVVCLVRNPDKGAKLRDQGCELVAGDLGDERAIRSGMEGCDAVIHAAAVYEVGIPASERAAMREANVGGTERVLGAALELKIPKVVYVSTVGIFGNTNGQIVGVTGSESDRVTLLGLFQRLVLRALVIDDAHHVRDVPVRCGNDTCCFEQRLTIAIQ